MKFDISVKNKVCLDVGASTGGFTEVLYSNGAKKIYSVDVGRDQLHHRLKNIEKIKSKDSDFTIPPLETPFFPTSNCGLTSITRSASVADSVKT